MTTCLLCDRQISLIDAHFFPRSWYNDTGETKLLSKNIQFSKRLRNGLYSNKIICGECDNAFGNYERNMANATNKFHLKTASVIDMDGFKFKKINVAECDLYFSILFLLWKFSATAFTPENYINIGPHFTVLKEILLNKNLNLAKSRFSIIICYYSDMPTDGDIFSVPMKVRYNGSYSDFNSIVIQVKSCQIIIKVDSRPIPAPFDKLTEFTTKGQFLPTSFFKTGMFDNVKRIMKHCPWKR